MDTASPSTAPRGDTNIANLGAGARVKQFAQGTNITQIEGFTADQVRVLIADLRASYQPKPFDGRSPYVGLASFQEQDADRFFGREQLTQELVARLKSARWLVIAGPSGSGKSSLARAGLFHALRKGALDDSENWLYEILTPGRHPLEPLARVVSSFTKSLHAGDEMQQRGSDDATLLHRWAEVALGDQRARRAILLVDQFEESFTQADETERAAFFNLLLYAATIENGRVTIVVCTRSDFIGNWAAYPQLNAQLGHGVNQIPPLQWHELVSAIERPALQAGLQIDPALTEQIIFDMQTAPGALPLMQFALDDLFHYAKSKGGVIALTREDYIARGGLQQALSRHADAEFAKLNPREQAIARGVFARLVEPGRGAVDTKRTALFQEIVLADADAAQVHETLAKLADARLVTTDEKTVTLAHERLIDAWGWLRKLVDENREAIALQNQIAQDALEWEQHKRDASYLYTGARLATAREQVADKKISLSALAQAFVEAGVAARAEAKRKETQRTRRLIMAFGAAAAVFAALAVVALALRQNALDSEAKAQTASTRAVEQQQTAEYERDRAEQAEDEALASKDVADTAAFEAGRQKIIAQAARATAVAEAAIARSRELAALARSQFETNPDLALLLAIEANAKPKAVTFESEDILRELLFEYPLVAVLRGQTNKVNHASFSPDGERIVTASDDGTVRVWDVESRQEQFALPVQAGAITLAQFSPDRKKFVTIGCHSLDSGNSCPFQTARIWNAEDGAPLAVIAKAQANILDAQFSADGRKIVTLECETDEDSDSCITTASVWDIVTASGNAQANAIAILRDAEREIASADFLPDGKTIVTLSCRRIDAANCAMDTVRLWDATTGQALGNYRTEQGYLVGAQFVKDSLRIVEVNTDDKLVVRDGINGSARVVFNEKVLDVTSAQFSPDGALLVTTSASEFEQARLWNAPTGTFLRALGGQGYLVDRAQFSPDGTQVVTFSSGWHTGWIWDVSAANNRAEPIAVLRGFEGNLTSVEYSPDGSRIVTANKNGVVRVWETAGKNEFGILRGHANLVNSAEFSPDEKYIVTASDDGTARIWDSITHNTLAILDAHKFGVYNAQFSPDGKWLVTRGCDDTENNSCVYSTAIVWNVARSVESGAGSNVGVLAGPARRVLSAHFSPDSSRIVTTGCETVEKNSCTRSSVWVWDTRSGEERAMFKGDALYLDAVFSRDGTRIAAVGCAQFQDIDCTSGAARVWDAANGKELATLRGHTARVWTANFSPDGKRIVTGSNDGTARVWETATGKELAVLGKPQRAAISAQFSPDGRRILTTDQSSYSRTALWDAVSFRELVILRGEQAFIESQYSPDSRTIVTPSRDNAYLWDAVTGRKRGILRGKEGTMYTARFSKDGKRIVTSSFAAAARIFLVQVDDLLQLVKKRIGRELRCDEREQYLNEENVCPTP